MVTTVRIAQDHIRELVTPLAPATEGLAALMARRCKFERVARRGQASGQVGGARERAGDRG